MAVAFDSTFEKGSAPQASPFSFASNAGTVTGTVTNNPNRILIGFWAIRGSVANVGTLSMSWDSVAMTAIGTLFELAGASTYQMQLFGLKAPNTGNKTLSSAWTGGGNSDVALGAVSLYNCDQTTGWSTNGTDTATGTAASSDVTTVSGDMAVVGHVNDNASSTTINVGSSAWIETALNGNYAQGYAAASGTTTTVSWTLGNSKAWGHVKVRVLQTVSTDAQEWLSRQAAMRGPRVMNVMY